MQWNHGGRQRSILVTDVIRCRNQPLHVFSAEASIWKAWFWSRINLDLAFLAQRNSRQPWNTGDFQWTSVDVVRRICGFGQLKAGKHLQNASNSVQASRIQRPRLRKEALNEMAYIFVIPRPTVWAPGEEVQVLLMSFMFCLDIRQPHEPLTYINIMNTFLRSKWSHHEGAFVLWVFWIWGDLLGFMVGSVYKAHLDWQVFFMAELKKVAVCKCIANVIELQFS